MFGVHVHVHASHLLVPALFSVYSSGGVVGFDPGAGTSLLRNVGLWVAVVFVCVLTHEFGHALAFRVFGVRSRIELIGFGGQTVPTDGPELIGWRDIVVSLAGVAAGFALGGAV